MRVLMIGLDRGLVGKGSFGDSVARHQKYAEEAGELDVIIACPPGHAEQNHSPQLRAIPTNTTKVFHLWGVLRIAKKLFKEHTYDLIVVQDLTAPAGQILKERHSVPLIIGLHSTFFEKGLLSFNVINQWGVWRIKKALRHSNGFRVNNKWLETWLRGRNLMQPVLVQPTPVDVSRFFTSEKPRSTTPIILYVGRLSPEKNVKMLIKAVQALEYEVILHIVGEGPERERLERLAAGNSRIKFLGPRAYSELPPLYKETTIFVLPSNTESFGKVLLEAAAARCAIIATETSGAKSILTHEKDALLTPVGDTEALTKALGRLTSDVDLQKSLGEQALERARKYDSSEGIHRTVEFWRQIAAAGNNESVIRNQE